MSWAASGPVDPTTTPAWARLTALAEGFAPDLRAMLADEEWVTRSTCEAGDLRVDLSKNLVTPEVWKALRDLADEVGLASRREAMLVGEHINVTEGRAVLHTALRLPADAALVVDGQDVVAEVHNVLRRVYAFADDVRSGAWTGLTGERVRTVVNIGIGGSDLGPVMAYEALAPYRQAGLECRYLSNIDPTDAALTLAGLDPASTLFIVSSKTFGTLETLTNARLCRSWLLDGLRDAGALDGHEDAEAVAKHFVAVSTALDRWPTSASTPTTRSGSGTGWAAATRWTPPSGSRSRSRSAPSGSPRCSRDSTPSTSTSAPLPPSTTSRC